MKRTLTLLTLCLLLLLTACGRNATSSIREVERNGKTYTVDTHNGTISDGENVYQFEVSGGGSSVSATITYPDGSTYWWNYGETFGHGGWSDDYDEDKYVSGDVLMDMFFTTNPAAKSSDSESPIVAFLLLVLGLFNAISPSTAWYLSRGWQFKDAEPSEAALLLTRCGGVVAVVMGVVMFFA